MTSKKSFLVSCRENNRRRLWTWIVSALVSFFYYPVGMTMVLSSVKNNYLLWEEQGIRAQLPETEALRQAAAGWLSPQEAQLVIVSLLAVMCAIQGFSWLYSKKKVDLYYSVPVKKNRRFAVIGLNSLLIFLVPTLAGLLLSMLAAAVNGAMSMAALGNAVVTLLLNVSLFAATCALIMIAVMLTGNVMSTLLASGVFLFYEIAVRGLLHFYMDAFFKYFSYLDDSMLTTLLSPADYYMQAMMKLPSQWTTAGTGELLAGALPFILKNFLLAALFCLIAFYCYHKRPSEAAGRTMAFPKTKGPVKILIVTAVTLYAGLFVRSITGSKTTAGNTALLLFAFAASCILAGCVIEVIYELDIRAAFRRKYQILISAGCVALFYGIFRFDLTGFDRWVPEPDKLQDAVVMINNETGYFNYYDENMRGIDRTEWFLQKQGIRDAEAVCELSAEKEDAEDAIGCNVAYRMKNGKTKWRSFPVPLDREETLSRIVNNQEFREATYPWYNESLFEKIASVPGCEVTFSNGLFTQNLSAEDMEEIRTLYIRDFEAGGYSTFRNEYVCGMIRIAAAVPMQDRLERVDVQMDIYPSYRYILDYLEEKGILKETVLHPEDFESITVTNYHNEMREGVVYNNYRGGMGMDGEGYSVTKTFTDEEQISELVKALYSDAFPQKWRQDISGNYSVTVQLKSSVFDTKDDGAASGYYRGSNSFYLITDRIPEFVDRETASQ